METRVRPLGAGILESSTGLVIDGGLVGALLL